MTSTTTRTPVSCQLRWLPEAASVSGFPLPSPRTLSDLGHMFRIWQKDGISCIRWIPVLLVRTRPLSVSENACHSSLLALLALLGGGHGQGAVFCSALAFICGPRGNYAVVSPQERWRSLCVRFPLTRDPLSFASSTPPSVFSNPKALARSGGFGT